MSAAWRSDLDRFGGSSVRVEGVLRCFQLTWRVVLLYSFFSIAAGRDVQCSPLPDTGSKEKPIFQEVSDGVTKDLGRWREENDW